MKKEQNDKTKNKIQKPSKLFNNCPACGCKNLIKLDVDALCSQCDWDSTLYYVSAGGMDSLIGAYIDHFHSKDEPKVKDREAKVSLNSEQLAS